MELLVEVERLMKDTGSRDYIWQQVDLRSLGFKKEFFEWMGGNENQASPLIERLKCATRDLENNTTPLPLSGISVGGVEGFLCPPWRVVASEECASAICVVFEGTLYPIQLVHFSNELNLNELRKEIKKLLGI